MQNATRIFLSIGEPLRSVLAASLLLTSICIGSSAASIAQETAQGAEVPTMARTAVVPQQVRYAGKLATRTGETVEAEFRIYAAAEGGEPLWTETQRVSVDEDGSYSVLLGSANSAGLPQAVFAGGAARWLGVSIERSSEQERVLLSSVPYAMKSADAESLSGHAASDFVTQEQLAGLTQSSLASGQKGAATPDAQPNASPTVTGSGTANTVPLWTTADTLGNSVITQAGTDIGINETTPGATLDVGGTATIRGALTVDPIGLATTSAAENSQHLNLTASAWSTATNSASPQTFDWVAATVGNNTATPSGLLYLQFQSGTAARTNLFDIDSSGVFHWAPSQTFPGTIGSVTAISPVTAITTSGAVSLGLNIGDLISDIASPIATNITPTLEGTFNAIYPQLGIYNTFASGASFGNTISATSATGDALYATTTGTGVAGYFQNSTTNSAAVYAENDATGNPGLGIALKGYVPNASSIAVLGKAAGTVSYGVYGENVGGEDGTGVYGSATGAGGTGIFGSASGGPDANYAIGSGVAGVSTGGRGVEGTSVAASSAGTIVIDQQPTWGVWGDASNAALGGGVLGTSDGGYGGYFNNNSSQVPALYVHNSGSSVGAGVFNNSSQNTALYVSNSGSFQAAAMWNASNSQPTLYLFNTGSAGTTNARTKIPEPATNGLFKSLMASMPDGTCGIGGNGDLSCTGQMKSLVSTGGGARKVETYAPQSAENWMEDYGTGVMERGVSVVKIDPAFAETSSETADYHVFITPNGDAEALYVINKTAAGFEVRESKGGTSSLTFDYKIVAKRRGYEAERLKDVTESFNAAKASSDQAQRPELVPAQEMQDRIAPAMAPAGSSAVKAALEAPEQKVHPAHAATPTSAAATLALP